MLPLYPESIALSLSLRPLLHPLFQKLQEGVSEFTFANIYLFREKHQYRLSSTADGLPFLLGRDGEQPFFILPFHAPSSMPGEDELAKLFNEHQMIKCATAEQAAALASRDYRVEEDRNNFDYLYRRQDLAELAGRHYHKKRNLVKAFATSYPSTTRPLCQNRAADALRALENWRDASLIPADFSAAREALEQVETLQLQGAVYYVKDEPVAYVLGEELAQGRDFALHFEKADAQYKGLYQYINQNFAASLPEYCLTVNREQDLGDPGLRKAKLSYKPSGFIKKFRVFAANAAKNVI